MRRDAANWRGVVVYYNPDDPRVIVPKRFSKLGGWTLNTAHPKRSLLVLSGLIVVLLGPSMLAMLAGVRAQATLAPILGGSILTTVLIAWRLSRG